MKIWTAKTILRADGITRVDRFLIEESNIDEKDFEDGFMHKKLTVISKMYKTRRGAFKIIHEQMQKYLNGESEDKITDRCLREYNELVKEYTLKYPEAMI